MIGFISTKINSVHNRRRQVFDVTIPSRYENLVPNVQPRAGMPGTKRTASAAFSSPSNTPGHVTLTSPKKRAKRAAKAPEAAGDSPDELASPLRSTHSNNSVVVPKTPVKASRMPSPRKPVPARSRSRHTDDMEEDNASPTRRVSARNTGYKLKNASSSPRKTRLTLQRSHSSSPAPSASRSPSPLTRAPRTRKDSRSLSPVKPRLSAKTNISTPRRVRSAKSAEQSSDTESEQPLPSPPLRRGRPTKRSENAIDVDSEPAPSKQRAKNRINFFPVIFPWTDSIFSRRQTYNTPSKSSTFTCSIFRLIF
ncbi:hypothetical protein DL96DRAFT_18094 [Flagelloscypha sp. PMI_526]|nr:hypothetical protein DL96DRAFT_18094 [Flagelloscypha sp. PMI_526]